MERHYFYIRSEYYYKLIAALKKSLLTFVLMFNIAVISSPWAQAQLSVDITQGVFEPIKLALPVFSGDTKNASQFAQEITRVITNDLENTGLFKIIDRESYLEDASDINIRPKFNNWRPIKAAALIQGQIIIGQDDMLEVKFRLWDIFAESQMIGNQYQAEPNQWRRIAHIVADKIYERLTGDIGYFDTRILFVAETGPADRRIKRLAIMDQDGFNHKILTDGRALVLTPRFSPTEQKITYLSYYKDTPQVFLFDLQTGEYKEIGEFQSMTYAPRFSPDGKHLIMAYAQDGNSDIYLYDLETNQAQRLTKDSAIDTSPSFAPDGNQIVFTSDRGGSPQLYTMDRNGSNVTRISYGKGRYSTPVWSPRGDLIAFTRQYQGQFSIGVMHYDGSGERLLSRSYLEESPSWSPNGRVLVFYRENKEDYGSNSLYSIDITGYNLRKLITPTSASDPAWSPPLQ